MHKPLPSQKTPQPSQETPQPSHKPLNHLHKPLNHHYPGHILTTHHRLHHYHRPEADEMLLQDASPDIAPP